MAIPKVDSVTAVKAKLEALLQRAGEIKTNSDIDPPLPAETFEGAPSPIVAGTDNANLTRGIIEKAARAIFYTIVSSTSIEDPSFVRIWNLLDILQYYEDRGQTPAALVLWLLEELLDSQDVNGCRTVFDYMESRREVLIANNFETSKNLVILRSCNELLRRVSRLEDAAFCGRVYLFLFLSFPLGDKSSVNPRGEFHVENVTTFEETPTESATDADPMAVDTTAESNGTADQSNTASTSEPVQVNVEGLPTEEARVDGPAKEEKEEEQQQQKVMDTNALYPIFWTLQQAFSDPTRLFNDESFDKFKRGLEATLAKFRSVPTVISTKGENKRGVQQENGWHDAMANMFNPKYLTSRDLFQLELSDLSFQRHILVQALILVEFLLSLTQSSKEKLWQANTNKALRYDYTLSDENAEWTLGIKKAIAAYLQAGPDGKFYYRMIDTVLSRDKNWVWWKLENCPEIKRPPVAAEIFQEAKSGAKRTCTTRRYGGRRDPTGSMAADSSLSFLTESDGSSLLDALKRPERYAPRSIEPFAKKIATIELDMDFAADDEERNQLLENKASQTWRALRIASRTKLGKFDKVEDGKNLDVLMAEPEPAPAAANNSSNGAGATAVASTATEASTGEREVAADTEMGTDMTSTGVGAGDDVGAAEEAATTAVMAAAKTTSSSSPSEAVATAEVPTGTDTPNDDNNASSAPENQGADSVAEQDGQKGLEEGRPGSASQVTAAPGEHGG